MRTFALLALLPLMLLVACKKPAASYPDENLKVDLIAPRVAQPAAAPAATGTTAPATNASMLAYDYSASLTVPDSHVRELMARHQQACVSAGAARCQVLQSSLSTDRGGAEGSLTLRAAPDWLAAFRGGLDRDAKAAGGAVTSSGVESEDLTRAIVDTEAALRAKTTLRDRLQKLLAEHPGKVSDLLEIEKQLADSQGEIDAAQSELAVMRPRVDMSKITLSYGSHPAVVARGGPPTVADALANFGSVVSLAASMIVYLFAFLIPFAIIVVPLVWLWRRRRARKKAAAQTPA